MKDVSSIPHLVAPQASVKELRLTPPPLAPDLEGFQSWLAGRTGYVIRNKSTFKAALTHRSADGRVGSNYDRLEFLGDAVANLFITTTEVAAHYLYPPRQLVGRPAPDMFRCNKWFERGAQRSGLSSFGLSSRLNVFSRGTKSNADLLESVAGAIYLDSGSFREAARFLDSVLSEIKPFRRLKGEVRTEGRGEDEEIKLAGEFRTFAAPLLPPGGRLEDAAVCLLAPLNGPAGMRLLELYRLGLALHQLLIKESVFASFPQTREATLGRVAAERSRIILKKTTIDPLWGSISHIMPEASRELGRSGDLEARIRYLGLLGAMFRAGGVSWVRNRLGWLYECQERGPFPTLLFLPNAA